MDKTLIKWGSIVLSVFCSFADAPLNINCWTPALTDWPARTVTLLPFLSCQWWIKRRAQGWAMHVKGAAYPIGLIISLEILLSWGCRAQALIQWFLPLTLSCVGLKCSWSGEQSVNQSIALHCMASTHKRLICCLVKLLGYLLLWRALKLCLSTLWPLKLSFLG